MITTARGSSLRLIFAAALFAALIAFVSVFAAGESAQAASFNPKGSACLDNPDTIDPDPFNPGTEGAGECDGDSSPGAKSSITTTFGIEAPDTNFGGVATFTPAKWGVAKDADVTDGAIVARLTSQAVLGLINGACNTALTVNFDLMDSTTNQSQTVIFNNAPGDGNIDPAKKYDADGPAGEQFELVNGVPQGVTKYPDYLTRILVDKVDPRGPSLPLRARLYGQTSVSGIDVSLNFAIFEPGVTLRDTTYDPELGYPSVTILQSAGDPDTAPLPGAITDFCSPLKTSTTTYGLTQDNPKTAGSEAGATFRTNPSSAGEYAFVTAALNQRDADNDGHENSLDTCPFAANPDWDPRAPVPPAGGGFPGDRDKDGLPDNCDPLPDDRGNPAGGINDHDGDGYYNRQDNCPLVKNSKGIGFRDEGGLGNQKDRDLDGIGDECDNAGEGGIGKGPDTADGTQTVYCLPFTVKIGSGGPGVDPNISKRIPCGLGFTATPTPPPAGQATPKPTLRPGETAGPGTIVIDGAPVNGVGSLAPVASSVPAWAAIVIALGSAGVIVSLGALAPRLLRRRRE